MKSTKLILSDFSGGQNDRDEPNKIGEFDAQKIENLFTDQAKIESMPGASIFGGMIQHSRFQGDENTIFLWHFNDTPVGDVFAGSDPSARYITASNYSVVKATLGNGIEFSNGGYAQPAWISGQLMDGGAYAQGNGDLTIEGNIQIADNFSGVPIGGVSNSGQYIASFKEKNYSITTYLGIFQDYDSLAGVCTNEPYLKFQVQVYNQANSFETYSISSQAIQRGVPIHARATYEAATGMINLYVNGRLVNSRFIGLNTRLHIGQSGNVVYFVETSVGGEGQVIYDEIRVSNIVRTDWPYLTPRPALMPLAKADGTRQLVVPAGDGLYYTSGDGRYTLIKNGLSSTAIWDGKQAGDYLFMTNGVDDPLCWDGSTLFPWGEGTQKVELWQTDNGTTPAAGTSVQIAYTFCYGDYETGLSVLTTLNNPSPNNIDVHNLPVGPGNCTARKLYSKSSNGTWYLWRVVADNTTTDIGGLFTQSSPASPYFDQGGYGISDGSSTGQLQTYPQIESAVLYAAVPRGKYTAVNYGAIFVSGMIDEPYSIRFADPGSPHVFYGDSVVSADSSHGPIIGMAVDGAGELMVSKNAKATLVLRGSSPQTWTSLETIHTSLGCVDHLAFVLHTVSQLGGTKETDRKILCFPCGDGHWYYNEGLTFIRLSDKISNTVKGLASANGSRFEWNTTTYTQYMQALTSGGSASVNVYNPLASTDGLRYKDGSVGMMPFMSTIALWGGESGAAFPAGYDTASKITWICKGASNGQYYFGVHDTGRVWYTADEFATVRTIGSGPAQAETPDGSPVIEIVRATVSGAETIFVFSAGGSVYRVNDPLGVCAWETIKTGDKWEADLMLSNKSYWSITLETERTWGKSADFKLISGFGNFYGKREIVTPGYLFDRTDQIIGYGSNLYVEGSQKVNISLSNIQNHNDYNFASGVSFFKQASVSGNEDSSYLSRPSHNFMHPYNFVDSSVDPDGRISIDGGFYQVRDGLFCGRTDPNGQTFTFNGIKILGGDGKTYWISYPTNGFNITHRKRQTTFETGGIARPQAVYDTAANKLYWVSYFGDDSTNESRLTSTVWYDAINRTMWSPIPDWPFSHFPTLAFDGATTYETTTATAKADGSIDQGFMPRLWYWNVLGRNFISTLPQNVMVHRLVYNPVDGYLYATGRDWTNDSFRDNYNYRGFIAKINKATGAFTYLKRYANYDAYPVEMAVNTVNGNVYCAMRGLSSSYPGAIEEVAIDGTVASLTTPTDETGAYLTKNMVFAESSGEAGDYVWPDRLMFPGADGLPVMRGVPGVWEVKGTFVSSQKDLGTFSAFDTFETNVSSIQPSQEVGFDIANPTDWVPVYKGQIIYTGQAVASLAKWRAKFSWQNIGRSDTPPLFDFVSIGYHSGTVAGPRVCGYNFGGRSYWGLAKAGETANSFMAVLQKNMTWVFKTGIRIDDMAEFLGKVIGISGANLVVMNDGILNLGDYAEPVLVTRNILDAQVDKCLLSARANISEFSGAVDGVVVLTPIRAGAEQSSAAWKITVPATSSTVSQIQEVGTPIDSFTYTWARSMAFKLSAPRAGYTKADGTLTAVPAQNQQLAISHLILDLRVTEPSYQTFTR